MHANTSTALFTTRSHLFTAYNAARTLARTGLIDRNRLDRALGVAQRIEPRPYVTTADDCNCPDARIRHAVCKHRLALLLRVVR